MDKIDEIFADVIHYIDYESSNDVQDDIIDKVFQQVEKLRTTFRRQFYEINNSAERNAFVVISHEMSQKLNETLLKRGIRNIWIVSLIDTDLTMSQYFSDIETSDTQAVEAMIDSKLIMFGEHQMTESILKRQKAIQELVDEVVETSKLFIEVQELVNQQGEQIDEIEEYINVTKEEIVAANEDLVVANEYQSGTSKMKMMLFSIPVVIGAAVFKILLD